MRDEDYKKLLKERERTKKALQEKCQKCVALWLIIERDSGQPIDLRGICKRCSTKDRYDQVGNMIERRRRVIPAIPPELNGRITKALFDVFMKREDIRVEGR